MTETYPEGTNLLEETFRHLTNRSIQLILRETDEENFISAFRGSSMKLQKRLCDNLSDSFALHLINVCLNEPMPDADAIIKAQHVMFSAYHKIMASG